MQTYPSFPTVVRRGQAEDVGQQQPLIVIDRNREETSRVPVRQRRHSILPCDNPCSLFFSREEGENYSIRRGKESAACVVKSPRALCAF